MKIYSDKLLKMVLTGSLLTTGLASMSILMANKMERNTIPDTSSIQAVTYTAAGKTNVQTAKLFKQLMQNNPEVQLSARIVKKSGHLKPPAQAGIVSVNYTLHGTTDVKTARKLIALFKNSKKIEIVANIKGSNHHFSYQPRTKNRSISQPYQVKPYSYYTPQAAQAILIQPVMQPMIWYKIPMNHQARASQKVNNRDSFYTYL